MFYLTIVIWQMSFFWYLSKHKVPGKYDYICVMDGIYQHSILKL